MRSVWVAGGYFVVTVGRQAFISYSPRQSLTGVEVRLMACPLGRQELEHQRSAFRHRDRAAPDHQLGPFGRFVSLFDSGHLGDRTLLRTAIETLGIPSAAFL